MMFYTYIGMLLLMVPFLLSEERDVFLPDSAIHRPHLDRPGSSDLFP